MANSRDFFDPAIMAAQFVGDQVAKLTAADLMAHGAKELAKWKIELDEVAQLKTLERFVKEDSLGKIFGDGKVLSHIGEKRTIDVTFFSLEDGSGVQIAKINGGENAMLALLEKASMNDLILEPQYREPKAAPIAAPKNAKLKIGDNEISVVLEEPKAVAVQRREPIDMRRAGGSMAVPGNNPVAMKAFLAKAWTANSMALPSHEASDMPIACIVATSPEAHPSDEAWPTGITVVDSKTGEAIAGPAKAIALFEHALSGREGPVVSRDDLVEQLRNRKPAM